MKKRFTRIIAVAVLMLGLMGQAAQAKEKVALGELNWDGGLIVMHAMKYVLENRLGVDVETIASSQEVIFAGMDKGDGSVDVHPDLWIPNRSALWAKYVAKGSRESVLVNSKPYIGTQGMFVPGYVQEEHGIKSISDLMKPGVSKLFDSDGNGRGEFWAGPTGWGSTNVELVKAKSYGYAETYDSLETNDSILKAKLKSDYAKKKPILFYFWTPEWIFAAFDLRRLEEPAFDGYAADSMKDNADYNTDGCWEMYQPKDREDWYEASSVACAWPDAQIYVAYSKSLEQRAPKSAKFFSQVYFETTWVNDWILKMAEEKMDPEEIIGDWVKANPGVVDDWVKGIE